MMMPKAHSEFDDLMQQVREGSETATRELVVNYGSHLLRVVRRKLHRALRSKFDSQDFVQAVWASFFAVQPERMALNGPKDLVALLEGMARNKVVDAVRQRLQTQKYSVKRERSLDQSLIFQPDALVAEQPGPEAVAIAREEWQHLLESAPARSRRILELFHDGQDREEIARDLGLNERTIRRVVRKLAPRPTNDLG
jgi:RNA polymerase sigma factor (sigma-70 family)